MKIPKHPHLRQRRNRSTTAATLPSVEASARNVVPILPGREGPPWHPRVLQWWGDVWRSPMSAEYLESDRGGLHILAELYQKFWVTEGARTLASLAAEIRQQEARFGLSPVDRRRLQWQIDQGETAEDRTKARRSARALQAAARKDPRELLKVVRDTPKPRDKDA